MSWNFSEAVSYYRRQGAPTDQSASIALLKEIQAEYGHIPAGLLPALAEQLGTKEGYFLALIRRIPSLRLAKGNCLELCAGPNCGKHTKLAAFAESLPGITVKFIPCQRMCGKGPNIRWNGRLYHRATEELIRNLVAEGEK